MRCPSLLVLAFLTACGSCGGGQRLPHSDREPVPVRFTIVNQTDGTVYVASRASCVVSPLSITRGGEALGIYPGQSTPCAEAKIGPCSEAGGCQEPGVRPLAPGERWTVEWDGAHYVDALLDEDEAAAGCPRSCVVALAAEPGRHVVTASAHRACEGPGCDCEIGPLASECHPSGLDAPELHAEASFTIPDGASAPLEVELAFR